MSGNRLNKLEESYEEILEMRYKLLINLFKFPENLKEILNNDDVKYILNKYSNKNKSGKSLFINYLLIARGKLINFSKHSPR